MPDYVLFMATGVFAGIASGLLGVGGGLIIVPVLFFIFSTQGIASEHVMHMALATSLATIIITSISSAYAHHKKQAVLWPILLILTPGILLGAWSGGAIASELDTSILKPVFGFFELLVGIHLLSGMSGNAYTSQISKIKSYVGGFIIGLLSAIVGIGGGTLTVPFLHWHNIPIRNAVATSAACGLPIAIAATASYIYAGWSAENLPQASLGYVHITAFALIIITSIVFAPIGAKLAHWLPELILRRVFGVFLLGVGLKMIW